jgi:hypothetical protein
MIESYFIEGAVSSGGAGVSTVTTTSKQVITGRVLAVGVNMRGTAAAATTDVTVRSASLNQGMPKVTLLALVNATADVWRQVYVLVDDVAGTDIAATYTQVVIHDAVEVVLAQGDDGQIVDVILVVEH